MNTICPRCKDAACEAVRRYFDACAFVRESPITEDAIAAIRSLPEPPTPSEEEIVERVAQAIYAAESVWWETSWGHNPPRPWEWDKESPALHRRHRDHARAALAVVWEREGR